MNLSYFRINIEESRALERLCKWMGKEPKERLSVSMSEAVDAATDGEQWKGSALYMYHNDVWTVFEDLSGFFSFIPSENWQGFAGSDKFVFAGYNDAILCAELIIIENSDVLREFREISDEADEFINNGEVPPAESWIDIASFVDDDEIVYSESGTLLIF